MEYAIDRLDELVAVDLERISETTFDLNEKERQEILAALTTEAAGVKRSVWEILRLVQSERQMRIVIRQYDISLEHFLELLEFYKNREAGRCNVKVHILHAFTTEINRLRHFLQRHFNVWLLDQEHNGNFFMHTSLNEAEIAALFFSLVDTRVITNHTYTSLFIHLAPLLATKHKKGLTAASLLKSKDKLSPDMKRKVKDLLMEMSRKVDGY